MRKKLLVLFIIIFVALIVFSACSTTKKRFVNTNDKNALSFTTSQAIKTKDNVIRWATNPKYPPYDWSADNKKYVGAGAELLSMIIPPKYKLEAVMVPWIRAQAMAKEGKIDLLVNLRFTKQRAEWLSFSKSPTFYNPIVVFMLKEKSLPLNSWDELRSLRGGISLGDTYGNGFDEYLAKNLHTEAAGTMVENFNKLKSHRIDYFVSGYYMGMAWLSSAGLTNRIVASKNIISNNDIYLGFSKKSNYQSLLPQIDINLAKLEKSGALNKLLRKYLNQFTSKPLKNFP